MRIEGTGKSAAIRIQVEGFKISKDLEVGASKIRRAFAASAELIAFYRKYRRELDQAALASLSAPGTA
jgi:hypothetical protein